MMLMECPMTTNALTVLETAFEEHRPSWLAMLRLRMDPMTLRGSAAQGVPHAPPAHGPHPLGPDHP
jgi:hypothetical protein